ncbi:MAG TPA: DUF1833 family protein [Vicinamibacterales bacterium]|nr:DUF1833 family protein [Vicinamibacterales bacterium]
MKSLSAPMTAAVAAQETGDEPLIALTITHPSLPGPIRLIDAPGDVVKNGNTYSWWPLRVTLPTESRDEMPSVSMELCSVDRAVSDAVLALSGDAPQVQYEVVLKSTPDVTERGPLYFDLRNIDGDVGLLRGALSMPGILDEPSPGGRMTPATHPALFPL